MWYTHDMWFVCDIVYVNDVCTWILKMFIMTVILALKKKGLTA